MGTVAAGWYADKKGESEYRWWDGQKWTDRVFSPSKGEDEPPTTPMFTLPAQKSSASAKQKPVDVESAPEAGAAFTPAAPAQNQPSPVAVTPKGSGLSSAAKLLIVVVVLAVGGFAAYSLTKDDNQNPSVNPNALPSGTSTQGTDQPGTVVNGTDTGGGDSAFLALIRQVADDENVDLTAAGISDSEYLTFGHDVCTRAQSGESWTMIYLDSIDAFPDATTIEAYFMPDIAMEAAVQTICPDQADRMTSELGF